MKKKKRSFFERLTGAVNVEEESLFDDMEVQTHKPSNEEWIEEVEENMETAELTVDMYQTTDAIIIKTIVAGVSPDDLDISITREMVTINGSRLRPDDMPFGKDIFYSELYWGNFSRTLVLPEEIDIEESTAKEQHGLLTLTLPKLDKKRSTKLKVDSD